eukprot:TRINITY_DN4757_c0_g1_i1.p1 TRINITY_DN4757_c0_g1~~TRINITY_DN4757_c0_g1_i1.p1  ORF type:complete len:215 (+),score=33.84 TRINITY_DN4757_c0_g1_i1:25-645(+)
MPPRWYTGTRAACSLCDKSPTKNAIEEHLQTHGGDQERVLIVLQGSRRKDCFKYVAALPGVTGRALQDYVTRWVDCGCGHMVVSDLKKITTVADFQGSSKLSYDMGSTTDVTVSRVGTIRTAASDEAFITLARTKPKAYKCDACDSKQATLYCAHCQREKDMDNCESGGFFCSEECHSENGSHRLKPVQDMADRQTSPRFCVCGYF